ncbi:MAG: VOC family protein, partial [Steroidobacteraceae bacterium]
SVPDVARSATFYSHLFQGGRLLGQKTPALRYEIDFHPGALSIGPLRPSAAGESSHPFIDHFCVVARAFDGAAWRARLDEMKVRHFAGGSFVDIGGISVQLFGARQPRRRGKAPPGGGFEPMPPLYSGDPLVRPHGFEHVTLHVANLDAAAARFHELFGLESHAGASGEVSFRLGAIRLGLRQAGAGETPVIAAFAIKVAPFDPQHVAHALEALGARVEPLEKSGRRTVLRFADPDGIRCSLRA